MTNGRTNPPTLEEVAAFAGVGRGTVSRVINKAPGVKAATRLAVERAITQLGYVPNHAARALAGSRTDAVALVITETERRFFAEPFFSEIVHAVGAGLAETEIQLLLTLVRTQKERQRFVQYARAGRVDGVLMVSVHGDDPLPDMLAELELPTVLSGRRSGDESVSYVDSDNVGGARSAVRHLVDTGRRAIATVTGPPDMYVAQCRLRGYQEEIRKAFGEVEPSWIARGDFTEESGRRATARLLELHPELDAVFAASDIMAAGALHTLRAAGRRVPEDVAVVGFDDSPLAQHTDPQLTTVRQPVEEMGRAMARVLLEDIENPSAAWRHVILRTKLVRRASA
ncbi:LacI family transcriptional regulator [Streptomyces agglomeratus]|uniref:LacI family transcriptional regulator n=1 Tax=Streptomyces agglomeratus TaxID=285458 RepID=A0A1E5PFD0_9ACTN|nr:LacI family DNA-binding transcriptional regulator [Streptomyces agglomeratus]OEJ28237.1 LacI family transcriptional regulator [Streptomyces agglomeratus]OEJ37698.1 LacI family transcriptional regulator [Streptomyces agglomeratus]OEJ47916.1 LacI family transcriptional regulator [Streptomyces agglomeratus]OEJ50238.1 LacI family transcriptional regulator [Streptomyces agglomeratus]OEJ57566.1 LacI family transcriptional regulator [Streptomyces agglomeratus]